MARREVSLRPWLKSSLPGWRKDFLNSPDSHPVFQCAFQQAPQLASFRPASIQPASQCAIQPALHVLPVDWEKKMEGLKIIQALARHHQALLKTNLHHVCQVVTDEVKHGRCCVVFAPIDTITELHVHLGKNMDPEVDWTGCVLLLKLAQTTQTFIHQRVNLALDALVKGCSPGRVVITLLNFGLSHQCHRVRESTALHLHQLTEIVGENWIVTAERHFAERFLTSVCKLTLDAATEVRLHGQEMLKKLGHQSQLKALWNTVVPKKDRHHLEKILGAVWQ
ncbi:TOG array regulator of axonemal microtubules protein 1-like [Scophthalmus maximus]|uniref:TOG array regulator of axonemal microtubules protein 1-like n=1 Tax=Scophthalmus maximus TaxID=52904 RepID=UPI001FA90653|nr:TOG array regulator of axonemal microtubules protein 1-like [Scophthalmus maximus]